VAIVTTFRQVAAFAFSLGVVAGAGAEPMPGALAAGTHLRFHLTKPISSKDSRSGVPFQFVMLDPVVVDGRVVVATGTVGDGTLILAGHAGNEGHEGDLTLRLDTIDTVDHALVTFEDQRFEINGRNRKIMSSVLGFVPDAGIGAIFIRGSDARLDDKTPITTVLLRPANITTVPSALPPPGVSAAPIIASPSAATMPSPAPAPAMSPTPSASP
jgi:hypothetical protein